MLLQRTSGPMQAVLRVLLLAALFCVAAARILSAPGQQHSSLLSQKVLTQEDLLLEVYGVQAIVATRRLQQDAAAVAEAPAPAASTNTTNATSQAPTIEEAAPAAAPAGADVVDTDPEPEDVSFAVVSDCMNVLESIQTNFPEFGTLITDVLPSVTPKTTTDKFTDPEAEITVLMPPRENARGVLYSHSIGDMSDEEVRDVVLVHILDQKLTFQDLVALPKETQIATLLDGAAIKPSLAGATSGSNAGQAGSGSIGLIDVDLDVCTDTSTMHTVRALLVPDDIDLPTSAAAREEGAEADSVTDLETVTEKDLPEDTTDSGSGGLETGAIIGIAVAAGLVLAAIITALCCCFNENCTAAMCGASRTDKKSSNGKDADNTSSMESTIGAKLHHVQGTPTPGSFQSEHGSGLNNSGNPTRPGSYALSAGGSGSHPSVYGGSTPGSHVSMHGVHAMGPGVSPGTDHSAPYSQRFTAYSSAAGTGAGSMYGGFPGSQVNTAGYGVHNSPASSMGSWTNMQPNASAPGGSRAAPHQSTNSSWRSMQGIGSDAYPYTTGPGGLTTMATNDAPSSQLTPPGDNASPDDIKAWVEEQLDLLGETPILGRFVSLGPSERRRGGQAVVQFASSRTDPNQYALKFFLSNEDFRAEKKIYTESPLGNLLPRHEGLYDNSDSILMDSKGHKLPPCIVMERGESLDEWSRRRKPDMWSAMPVLANIAKRLEAMHGAGYAHRDLKPANVMWLSRENQWTLIDFGCAAQLNEQSPLSFTLGYAAPETISTWRCGEKTILSQASTDAWSLGVMVYELLTGKPAFDVFLLGRESVVKQLLGEEPLPWERMAASTRKTLGAFKGPIMQLLNRDPTKRPTMSQFYDNCNAIFSTSTTYTPGKNSMGSNSSDLMHVESGIDSSANNTEGANLTEGATLNASTEMPRLATQTITE